MFLFKQVIKIFFIEMQQKKKILGIMDHPMSCSGVATQARFLINGLIQTGKYTFRCLGAAIKHNSYDTISPNPDLIIKPINGFGSQELIRQLVATEKPDALFLFTDPRFFAHIWALEDEIHRICPIVYNHLWDNLPSPMAFNKYVYESCDLINCINYPTYEMVSQVFPEKTNYIPHAVPTDLYKSLPEQIVSQFRNNLLRERASWFKVLYVSRNARRKMTADVMFAFKQFLDQLEIKHGHRNAILVMHTDPMDQEGTNLFAVLDLLQIHENVVFSKEHVTFDQMALLYNSCDTLVNISSAEGFGLPVLEMKMCEKPVIAIKTGGLTRQVEDHESGEQYGVALNPDAKVMVGNHSVPYIFDDHVSHENVAKAYMTLFEMGNEKRKEIGKRAREHAIKNYNFDFLISEWDRTLSDTIKNWRSRYEFWRHVEL